MPDGNDAAVNAAVRVGIDIGGTFTDLVLVDERTGSIRVNKLLTTPRNPANAVCDGFSMATLSAGVAAADVTRVVHGTTLVTNAVVERKGARAALVTTAGFRDTLEIATENRYDMYDLKLERPAPLVPRRLRFEVAERLFSDGAIEQPLDEAQLAAVAERMWAAGVEAVAVCFINSYRNGAHERHAVEILSRLLLGIPITISSEVNPEIREYHRAVTTVVNAYVMPLLGRYVAELRSRLRETGFKGDVFLMLSNGGICTVETAKRFPVRLIESGPAAGALATAHFGLLAGHENLLSFDMGGTTAKACFIESGRPITSPTVEVAHVYRFKQGSGFPLQVRSMELIEIGAGGGSIARVDKLGLLRVGPESAGSDPGPVSYGLGGTEPTVTDADLLLGYLDPGFFLGGKMALDRDAALQAVESGVARPLGLTPVDAAYAIHRIVNENMASAARTHAIERGKNPQRYPLFAFGGAGPVHAVGVARILGARTVIVPMGAGVISAAGLLIAPFAFDFVRSYRCRLDQVDWERVGGLFDEMTAEGAEILTGAGVRRDAITVTRLCSMRYVGQGTEIEVPIPTGPLDQGLAAALRAAFNQTYGANYNATNPGVPVEVLTWRVSMAGPGESVRLRFDASPLEGRHKGDRQVYFGPGVGFVITPVYDRYALRSGDHLEGPAIVEERESTTVIDPHCAVNVDAHANLVITLR
jgi:N-methylhydantoinase A